MQTKAGVGELQRLVLYLEAIRSKYIWIIEVNTT